MELLIADQTAENNDLKQKQTAERIAFKDATSKLTATKREVHRLESQLTQAAVQVETAKKKNAAVADELRQLKSSGESRAIQLCLPIPSECRHTGTDFPNVDAFSCLIPKTQGSFSPCRDIDLDRHSRPLLTTPYGTETRSALAP